MFPILFRVLTIAGSCTIAALLTRRYLQRKAEEENRYREQLRPQFAEGGQSTSDALSSSNKADSAASQSSSKSDKSKLEEESARKAKVEAQAVADIETARRTKEAALAAARQAKNEKLAKTREAAAAAQKAAEAHRRSAESGSFPAVPAQNVEAVSTEMSQAALEREQASAKANEESIQSAQTEMSEAAAQSALAQDFSPEEKTQAAKVDDSEIAAAAIAEAVESKKEVSSNKAAEPGISKAQGPAEERAKVVLQSSKQIIDNYKQPEGTKVDLSLAQFSIETAERLMAQSRFEEAFEKASAVGLLVGMAEMRAAIETQLKAMKSDEKLADKAKSIRSILNEADASLAQASQSFVSDDVPAGQYMNHLQTAFQKTMQAQNEMMNVSV